MTACSTSNTSEKIRRDEINTGCCWNKFSEFKSQESSDLCNSSKGVRGIQEEPGRQPDNRREACGRYRSSSVHPDRFPPFLSQDWWYTFSASVLVETSRDRSCPVSTVHHRNLSTHSFCSSTHQNVLECGAAAAFQKLRLGAACGAAAPFKKSSFSNFTLIFFSLCVM